MCTTTLPQIEPFLHDAPYILLCPRQLIMPVVLPYALHPIDKSLQECSLFIRATFAMTRDDYVAYLTLFAKTQFDPQNS